MTNKTEATKLEACAEAGGQVERVVRWQPDPKDVEKLCDAILDSYIEEDNQSCDCCKFCYERYGNVNKNFWNSGRREPHKTNCPVLVARDVLTGIST